MPALLMERPRARARLASASSAVRLPWITPRSPRGRAGRRIDFRQPEASLLLLKGTGHLGHVGGQRLKKDSWEYRLLRQWIQEGTPRKPAGGAIVRLQVVPAKLFANPKEHVQSRVVAAFADGTSEDVTLFTAFRTPEPEVVEVTSQGRIRALSQGSLRCWRFTAIESPP